MKKALIIFIILLIFTVFIPFTSVIEKNKEEKASEVVTIFNAQQRCSFYEK